MNTSPELDQIGSALCLAQAEIAGAHKNAANPFFKSKYSDLASCWAAVREPLTKHALSVVQSPSADGAKVSVETLLLHASGQWMSGTMTATAKDDSPQAIISIVTYLRRAGLSSFCSIAPVDDDAESAQSHAAPDVIPPEGFHRWLDDLTATADEGQLALKQAWTASPKPLRAHLTERYAQRWANLKLSAAAVEGK
jgi:hypothetical protein|tara:strand:+ start:24 stop:611 length:588 start_codon:yes stop_codon:yes gene_type:complete